MKKLTKGSKLYNLNKDLLKKNTQTTKNEQNQSQSHNEYECLKSVQ